MNVRFIVYYRLFSAKYTTVKSTGIGKEIW